MKTTGNNKTLKFLTGILVLLLLGLGIYTIKFYNTVQDNARELIREKEVIALELRDMLRNYEEQKIASTKLRTQLSEAKERITRLLDSLTISRNTRDVLRSYRKEITELRSQRDDLLRKNDSLALLTTNLQNEKNTVRQAFDIERDSLRRQNEALQEQLNNKAAIKLINLQAEGVIVRRSGKEVANTLAKRIDNIKVCYEIEAQFIPSGVKLYTQVIAPGNNVLGERKTISFGEKILTYSSSRQAPEATQYDTKEFCELIPAGGEKFDPGIYHISIFKKDSLMTSTMLQLD